MKYLEIVKKLQNLSCNTDVLVLVRSGVFFYGVGKDAVILTENLGLNYCCMKKELCKCAIPVIKIEKIIKILEEKRISFAIYDYTPKGINEIGVGKYKEIGRYISSPISETREHFNCSKCQYHNLIDYKITKNKEKIKQTLIKLQEMSEEDGK